MIQEVWLERVKVYMGKKFENNFQNFKGNFGTFIIYMQASC